MEGNNAQRRGYDKEQNTALYLAQGTTKATDYLPTSGHHSDIQLLPVLQLAKIAESMVALHGVLEPHEGALGVVFTTNANFLWLQILEVFHHITGLEVIGNVMDHHTPSSQLLQLRSNSLALERLKHLPRNLFHNWLTGKPVPQIVASVSEMLLALACRLCRLHRHEPVASWLQLVREFTGHCGVVQGDILSGEQPSDIVRGGGVALQPDAVEAWFFCLLGQHLLPLAQRLVQGAGWGFRHGGRLFLGPGTGKQGAQRGRSRPIHPRSQTRQQHHKRRYTTLRLLLFVD